ncbi:MAG: ATP-dependent RNA helicase HrpA [Acidimicrobiales bacterium]
MPSPRRRSSQSFRPRPVREARPIEVITYPPDLPVSERRDEIRELVGANQVVIVSGETGSGKTTQLPKICLELGRGIHGMIGHTQPRRIAARAVAERLAEELEVTLGAQVGYAVRFSDQVGPETLVKVMTDGILLAELQRDRDLGRYDTLIVDEAHERSLNIDFILGYLKSLLPRRPDLKVIVTSATIDTERFSAHFDGAPVVEVTGRTYPVEVRYQPWDEEDTDAGGDQVQAVCDAVADLGREGPGDILVFLSGEREIRDTAEALRRLELDNTEILPLYARLSTAEQHRVFRPHPGRRVVLSTNVAETSLTVPGIRYVIDTGLARVSRYNRRTKVQRLPIEPVSQASANQRAGRCGRLGPGICVRLYSEEDFEGRPAFTDPEILRTNLAAVILQMAAIGLGDVAGFPFVDPPDARHIRDGVDLLEELGALSENTGDPRHLLTPVGRRLARLPVDPRLGRMVLEAERNDCLREVVIIAAAMSIQDPRERPADKRQAADEAHARFRRPGSDFLAFLDLWNYLQESQQRLSSSQFRRQCRNEFLSYQRVREWQDVCSQLRQIGREMGLRPNSEPAPPDVIHRSLLAGLLTHVGMWDPQRQDYLGARSAHWAVAPGSALHRRSTRWVMAGELVETSRMWARTAAGVRPEWIEPLAGHLVKRSYGEPYWDPRRAASAVEERVTLYGIPIVAGRRVSYSRVDPDGARDMFIQQALVEGDWPARYDFMEHNATVMDEARRLQEKSRRGDLVAADDVLFDFFDARVPPSIASGDAFDRWWRRQEDRQRLDFSLALLVGDAGSFEPGAYPEVWNQGELSLALTYKFDPLSTDDGVSVHIPVAVLEQVDEEGFDWHIPAFREELVTALIRSLPKTLRRHFVPAPDHARAFLASAGAAGAAGAVDGPLLDVLSAALTRSSGLAVPPGSWDPRQLPAYLRLTFVVEDAAGGVLAAGQDLGELKLGLARRARAEVATVFSALEVRGASSFEWEALPAEVSADWRGQTVRGYPALVDRGEHVDLRVYANSESAASAMWSGTRRLLLLNSPGVTRALRSLTNRTKLAISRSSYASVADLLADCTTAAADALLGELGGPARSREGFEALLTEVRAALPARVLTTVAEVGEVLADAGRVRARLDTARSPALVRSVADMVAQIDRLTAPGFVLEAGLARLADLQRYLRAVEVRVEKASTNPDRDLAWMQRVHQIEDEWAGLLERRPVLARTTQSGEIRWMIEDLRVSLFAQTLGSPRGVSEVRIRRAIAELSAAP